MWSSTARAPRRLREATKKCVAAGQGWRCGRCEELLPSTYEINHIEPHCISQDDDVRNLVAVCNNCHAWFTQQQAVWLHRARLVQAASRTAFLCIGCRKVVSTFFLPAHRRSCSQQFSAGCFPRRATAPQAQLGESVERWDAARA